jgi:DNA repair exonuclease SbcCD ATPase subunit
MSLAELKEKCVRLTERRKAYLEEAEYARQEQERLDASLADFGRAQTFFAELAEQTQRQFREQVERLGTAAVRSVFDRPYAVKLVSEKRRGRMETEILIVENGQEFQPTDEMGGSIVDLLSFAMRVILWSLQFPRARNVFILDEPMKFLGTGVRLQHAVSMLAEIARNLQCQLIIVTHDESLATLADTAYKVTHNGVESNVQLIKSPKPTILKRRSTT